MCIFTYYINRYEKNVRVPMVTHKSPQQRPRDEPVDGRAEPGRGQSSATGRNAHKNFT